MRTTPELDGYLLGLRRDGLGRRPRGKTSTKAQLLLEDRAAFRKRPDAPPEACRAQGGQPGAESRVRFEADDYPVPLDCAHHPVTVKGYVGTAAICYGLEVIALHPRIWEKAQQSLLPCGMGRRTGPDAVAPPTGLAWRRPAR